MITKKLLRLKSKYKVYIYLLFIILSAFYFRTFNINWDNNYYFHPDERAIIMYASPLKFPSSLEEFMSVKSPLNPHFFAYGNFPLYLVKALGSIFSSIDATFTTYGGMHIIGRLISATADTLTVFIVFILGTELFSKRTGLFASLLYGLSVFPIQTSHFFAVDSLLTFFMTATLLLLVSFIKSPSSKKAAGVGLFFGFVLATKVSGAILALSIINSLLIIYFSRQRKYHPIQYVYWGLALTLSTLLVFCITQPYVLIDIASFIEQTSLQSQMGKNPFVFPYTLQYVGKLPYVYELKNIFLYGMGPIISTVCFCGVGYTIYLVKKDWKKNIPILFVILYMISYFIVFGKFAVGWMRYMLPIYPILALFGGLILSKAIDQIPKELIRQYVITKSLLLFTVLLFLLYPVSFLSIYMQPNTRIQASEWISKNIPPGSNLAVEHWDDALPVFDAFNYISLSLPLYDPDTSMKWSQVDALLNTTDYIILASNRLYVPLQKLTDCKKLPQDRCYPKTSAYYKDLFAGKRGFTKVAEFSEYPTIPFFDIKLNDQGADESFTVYDHPKVIIFKKN